MNSVSLRSQGIAMKRRFETKRGVPPSTCKLCLQPGKVIYSHIISDFLHEPLYDEKHRLHVLSGDAKIEYLQPQQGLREYILCEQCDNVRLGGYEGHGRRFLDTINPDAWPPVDPRRWKTKPFPLSGIDYGTIRLFYLSLLWRMSVASHVFFADVSLGPYEEILRQMLLNEDPGKQEEFAIICFAPYLDGTYNLDLITRPERSKQDQRTAFRFVMRGFIYLFLVGKADLPAAFRPFILNEDGTWVIVREDVRKIDFLAEAFLQMRDAMKSRETLKRTGI
jgi:hypothetical protein